jgi:hypothetical protein
MFEVIVISGNSLQAFQVPTLREALRLRYVYGNMGLLARIWPT